MALCGGESPSLNNTQGKHPSARGREGRLHLTGSSLGRGPAGAASGGGGGGVEWWRAAPVEQHIGEALLGSKGKGASGGGEGGSHSVGSSLGRETAGAAREGGGGGVGGWRAPVCEQHIGEASPGDGSERWWRSSATVAFSSSIFLTWYWGLLAALFTSASSLDMYGPRHGESPDVASA